MMHFDLENLRTPIHFSYGFLDIRKRGREEERRRGYYLAVSTKKMNHLSIDTNGSNYGHGNRLKDFKILHLCTPKYLMMSTHNTL